MDSGAGERVRDGRLAHPGLACELAADGRLAAAWVDRITWNSTAHGGPASPMAVTHPQIPSSMRRNAPRREAT